MAQSSSKFCVPKEACADKVSLFPPGLSVVSMESSSEMEVTAHCEACAVSDPYLPPKRINPPIWCLWVQLLKFAFVGALFAFATFLIIVGLAITFVLLLTVELALAIIIDTVFTSFVGSVVFFLFVYIIGCHIPDVSDHARISIGT